MNNKSNKNHRDNLKKDFLTGCLVIVLICIVLALAPFLIFILRLSLVLVIPIVALFVLIILAIFLGRIINSVRKRDGNGK